MTMVLFTAVAVVRERERGNIELLITTPVTPLELMVGKVLPYIGIGLLQTTIVLALGARSEEHTSELQSLMRISYAVFCLKKKKKITSPTNFVTIHHKTR